MMGAGSTPPVEGGFPYIIPHLLSSLFYFPFIIPPFDFEHLTSLRTCGWPRPCRLFSPFPFIRASPGSCTSDARRLGKDRECVVLLVRDRSAPHPRFRSTSITSSPHFPFHF